MFPPRSRPLLIAVVLAAVYLGLAVVAYMHYPGPFSPLHNWLSDLGNRKLNPAGATYYRIGSEAGGVLMAAFFVIIDRRRRRSAVILRSLRAMQSLGVLAGIAFVLSGIFPDDVGSLHDDCAAILFGSFSMALIVSLIVFPVHRDRHWIMIPMAVFCWCSVVAGTITHVRLLEWTSLGGFLAYTLLLGVLLRRAPEAVAQAPHPR